MCQRDNNPTKKKTTAEGHQQVNVARNSHTGGVLQLAPKQIYTKISDNERHTNFQIVHKKLKLKIIQD